MNAKSTEGLEKRRTSPLGDLEEILYCEGLLPMPQILDKETVYVCLSKVFYLMVDKKACILPRVNHDLNISFGNEWKGREAYQFVMLCD